MNGGVSGTPGAHEPAWKGLHPQPRRPSLGGRVHTLDHLGSGLHPGLFTCHPTWTPESVGPGLGQPPLLLYPSAQHPV